jgi:hypothetical protein
MILGLVQGGASYRFEQTESYIYVATERLIPLRWHIKRKSMSTETLKWGLFGVAVSAQLSRWALN